MPKVGKKSFSYGKKGKEQAKEYADKSGLPMQFTAPPKKGGKKK